MTSASATSSERHAWPSELTPVFERFVTVEFATLTRHGAPITWPVTPFPGRSTIDVSTGLVYPSKAERARRDPRVALLFSSPTGSGLDAAPTVLVQGLATVRDGDLQHNLDRYLDVALDKVPDAYAGVPPSVLARFLDWYWPRIWIEVTPLRIAWWAAGEPDARPSTWAAPDGTAAPPSDPAPRGPTPGPWAPVPSDLPTRLAEALTLGMPVVTTTEADGWPLPVRVRDVRRLGPTALELVPPPGITVVGGPVCLTFHRHPERFDRQDNAVFVGTAAALDSGHVLVEVERALGDFSLPGGRIRRLLALVRARRQLRPRLFAEAGRRGQPVPTVRLRT